MTPSRRQPIIRESHWLDAVALWGELPERAFQGITATLNGQVLGIAGVMHTVPLQAFMTLKPEMKQYKRTMVKTTKRFKELLDRFDSPIYAFPHPDEPTADGFLTHIGFTKIEEGKYRWTR